MKTDTPLISIICPTYNQEKYIAQTLDGFVGQETSYPFEIIIHDDASVDNTVAIVKQYEARYPHLFANIYQTENQYSKGLGRITRITFAAAKGKYIALCEGDDYWTDPLKLQKQVSFLEAHPDYSTCFHRVYEKVDKARPELSTLNAETTEQTYTIEDLARGNFIHTPSVIFLRGDAWELPEQFMNSPATDYVIHLLNAKKGKIKYLPDVMAVYRKHSGGIWSGKSAAERFKKMAEVIWQLLSVDFSPVVLESLHNQYSKISEESLLFLLMDEEFDAFARDAKAYFEKHPERTAAWIYERVPRFFKTISQSRIYKFSKKLSSTARRLKLMS